VLPAHTLDHENGAEICNTTPLLGLFEHGGWCLQPRPDVVLRSWLNRYLARRDIYEGGLPRSKTRCPSCVTGDLSLGHHGAAC